MSEERRTKAERMTFNRRRMLGLMGTAGVAAAGWGCGVGGSSATSSSATTAASVAGETTAASAGAVIPSCILSPEVTEGPYYLEGDQVREDITEDREGVPLRLRVTVADSAECVAITNAAVDIWHCDAGGAYSGFVEASSQANGGGTDSAASGEYEGGSSGGAMSGGMPEPPSGQPPEPPEGGEQGGGMGAEQTDDLTFLRGVQLTDSEGVAEFETIYPGWYQGRALHIHLKVMVGGTVEGETYEGGHVAHTGQIFFPEEITEQIEQISPYANASTERVPNAADNIFQQAGSGAVATLTPIEEGRPEAGYTAEIVVGVDPDSTSSGSPGEQDNAA